MEHKKTVTLPAQPEREESVYSHTTCDLCGETIQAESLYEVNEVTIEHKKGNCYPGSPDYMCYSVDCCGKCWERKVVPWLWSQGAKINEKLWQ